ncbi:hypothetical protein PAXRUDRAFT_20308 [Paxillus rubicundulus Ve08.2h10]|uniref:Uncharacterized protein n=1 Tax=Paxillus rubicundulus Ve08.2h10 TaxID=930991 RepID=A0A0D0BR92_9AGAM|nr:hypothetical protein PAXRUDRAFT_20308 [Paxillus rubicundulus Ve08.2h10]
MQLGATASCGTQEASLATGRIQHAGAHSGTAETTLSSHQCSTAHSREPNNTTSLYFQLFRVYNGIEKVAGEGDNAMEVINVNYDTDSMDDFIVPDAPYASHPATLEDSFSDASLPDTLVPEWSPVPHARKVLLKH